MMMTKDEMDLTIELVNQCRETLDKPRLTTVAQAMFAKLLLRFTFRQAEQAVFAHMSDPKKGKFAPSPSDLIEQIERRSPKEMLLTADEAWAIAVQAESESSTVVWTQEIAQAWFLANPAMPDKVATRMAFKAAYERVSAGKQPVWIVSMGTDECGRKQAISQAVELGRLSRDCYPEITHKPPTESSATVLDSLLKRLEKQ